MDYRYLPDKYHYWQDKDHRVKGVNIAMFSIKPEYCDKILNGVKRFEYRKAPPKKCIEEFFMYATAPVKKVVGSVRTDGELLSASPRDLWLQTQEYASMSEKDFFAYFKGCPIAYAFPIKRALKLYFPLKLKKRPPQNFYYI